MRSVSRERKGKGALTIDSAFTAASGGRAICMTYASSVGFTSVAAAILAAVEGGILPPGPEVRNGSD